MLKRGKSIGEVRFMMMMMGVDVFFFFQAEDGIRDIGVTGVQTCALPIYYFTCSFENS